MLIHLQKKIKLEILNFKNQTMYKERKNNLYNFIITCTGTYYDRES